MWNPLNLFGNKKVDEFSRTLAHELSEIWPPGGALDAKKSDKRLGRALDVIYVKAKDFRKEQRLGIYGKAKLGNSFKWELKELGYDDEFIEEATRGLIIAMSRA